MPAFAGATSSAEQVQYPHRGVLMLARMVALHQVAERRVSAAQKRELFDVIALTARFAPIQAASLTTMIEPTRRSTRDISS